MIKTLVIIYFIITALVFCIVLAILVKDKFMSRKYNRITVFISYLRFILLKNFYKKIIVGASGRNIKGYLATEQRYLDITNDDWKKYFDSSSLDEIIAEHVFEHLENPDIAFYNCWQMLKPGGRFFIHDAIIEEDNAIENVEALIEKLGTAGGNFMREDAEGHFREEYSTYDWIMEGLLTRTGFEIDSKAVENGVIATYYCTRGK